jgi:hypothetical protein
MPLRPLYPTDTERHISIVKLFVQKRYLERRRRRRLRVNHEIAKMIVHFKHRSRSFNNNYRESMSVKNLLDLCRMYQSMNC